MQLAVRLRLWLLFLYLRAVKKSSTLSIWSLDSKEVTPFSLPFSYNIRNLYVFTLLKNVTSHRWNDDLTVDIKTTFHVIIHSRLWQLHVCLRRKRNTFLPVAMYYNMHKGRLLALTPPWASASSYSDPLHETWTKSGRLRLTYIIILTSKL